MNIDKQWLENSGACTDGREWFNNQKEIEVTKVIKALIKENRFEWANWTITRVLSHQKNVLYSCYAAKQSLHSFQKQYPQDKRPRQAILAAIKWTKFPTGLNKLAAESAARSAAGSAASAAGSAAWSAARSA